MLNISHIQKTQIPQNPGVYIFKTQKGKILYIGKAKNLKKRIGQYFTPGSVWKQDMLSQAEKIERIETKIEQEALFLEENLIKEHQPEYNKLLKNNTQYVYIKITKEEFPQISIVRKKTSKKDFFIGPKNHTKNLKKFLSYIKNFYKLRDCNNSIFKKGKLCTKYDFGLCKGRCNKQNLIEIENNKTQNIEISTTTNIGIQSKNIKNYQSIIEKIKNFFEGKTKFIQKDLLSEINKAIKKQNFERADKLKKFYLELDDRTNKQTIILNKNISGIIGQISKIYIKNNNKNGIGKQSGFFIFSVIRIVEGKIIDVIRGKEFIKEIELSALIRNIKNEFNINIIKKIEEDNNKFIFHTLSKSITKKEFIEIKQFLLNSIQNFISSDSFQSNSIMNELLKNIQIKYYLKNFPYKIECLDISHFQGDWTSGGLSCFIGGIKYSKGYRKYKIKTSKNNDYKAIEEVINRRFNLINKKKEEVKTKNNNESFPDLFIIDGGIGQLNILKNIMFKNNKFIDIFSKIDFISIGKGEARNKNKIDKDIVENIYLFNKNFDIIKIPIDYDESDKILIKIRDESHRFANYYRKQQMKKEWK